MSKIRKTRQEKIILQLKRKLASDTNLETRQEAKLSKPQIKPKQKPILKSPDSSVFSFDSALVKKNIFKTLALTLIVISLEVVLYLRLR